MMEFYDEKNLPKASEYAQLTLKSADWAHPKDESSKEHLRKVRCTSHHIIVSELLERGNFSQAIAAFEAAIEAESYAGGYYGIGLCLDRKREIEDAFPYYAAAELMGGEEAQKAKERLEVLYKSLHNDTLVGIDKVYTKARELMAKFEG
jgi:tetratricopeptide (TPR) repeat protein